LDIGKEIYEVLKKFPKEEIFGLTNQLRKVVTSIVLNIAEGTGCESSKEFARFLNDASRSQHEAIACLDITERIGYIDEKESHELKGNRKRYPQMIVGLKRSIKRTE
jgi:four helix bundle protein